MSMDVLGAMAAGEAVGRVARLLGAGERVSLSGAAGSSTVLLAGAVARGTGRPVLLMLAHGDEAEAAVEELSALGAQAVLLPALEVLPGESGVSVEQAAARLRAVRAAVAWRGGSDRARVLVTTIQALMQGVPPLSEVETSLRAVRAGERLDPAALAAWLTEHGYTRVEVVSEVGEFAVRGGIVDVFPPGDPFGSEAEGSLPGGLAMAGGGVPVRLDMLGDVVERVSEIDVETMGSDRAVAGVHLAPAQWGDGAAPSRGPAAAGGGAGLLLPAVLPEGFVAVLSELSELTEQGRGYYERVIEAGSVHGPPAVFAQVQRRCAVVEVSALGASVGGGVRVPVSPAPGLAEDSARAVAELCELATSAPGQAPLDVVVVCQNEGERSRLVEMVAAAGPVPPARLTAAVGFLRAGLVWHEPLGVRGGALGPVPAGQSPESAPALLLVPLAEVLHRYTVRGALRWAASRGGGGGCGWWWRRRPAARRARDGHIFRCRARRLCGARRARHRPVPGPEGAASKAGGAERREPAARPRHGLGAAGGPRAGRVGGSRRGAGVPDAGVRRRDAGARAGGEHRPGAEVRRGAGVAAAVERGRRPVEEAERAGP